jgi:putative tryptophan/tyrosine transport system substrate-binding protein
MNGPRTVSGTPVGHLHGQRGRSFFWRRGRKGRLLKDLLSARRVTRKSGGAVFGAILALALLAILVPSSGTAPAKVYRIGRLSAGSPETGPRICPSKGNAFWQTWIEALRDRGYVQGRNLVLDCRYTEGQEERAIPFASELVNLKPDLIVAAGTNQVRAVKQATSTIPIVMHDVIEPVRRGLVASLARPGGNVTGVTDTAGVEIYAKYLQLLKGAVPTISRVAALRYPGALREATWVSEMNQELEAEARALGIVLQSYYVTVPEELEVAFVAMAKARSDALLLVPHPSWGPHIQHIIDLAARNRLPAMYPDKPNVERGGLMAYAVDWLDTARRIAEYSDRILKGAKPGELPVEQPTRFMLILNLKTAKALGLTIPPTFLIQAEEVIR